MFGQARHVKTSSREAHQNPHDFDIDGGSYANRALKVYIALYIFSVQLMHIFKIYKCGQRKGFFQRLSTLAMR